MMNGPLHNQCLLKPTSLVSSAVAAVIDGGGSESVVELQSGGYHRGNLQLCAPLQLNIPGSTIIRKLGVSGGAGGLAPSSLDVEGDSEKSGGAGGRLHCDFCSSVVQRVISCSECCCRFHADVAWVGVDHEVTSCLLREKSKVLKYFLNVFL